LYRLIGVEAKTVCQLANVVLNVNLIGYVQTQELASTFDTLQDSLQEHGIAVSWPARDSSLGYHLTGLCALGPRDLAGSLAAFPGLPELCFSRVDLG
jgi:hypothetical protein